MNVFISLLSVNTRQLVSFKAGMNMLIKLLNGIVGEINLCCPPSDNILEFFPCQVFSFVCRHNRAEQYILPISKLLLIL